MESSSLSIQPVGILRWHRDVADNCLAMATFNSAANQLRIESSLIIQHYGHQLLDCLVEDDAVAYPFCYAPKDRPVVDAYRGATYAGRWGPLVPWTSNAWRPGEALQSHALLKRLNRTIHQTVACRRRDEPGVQTPAETLSSGCGT